MTRGRKVLWSGILIFSGLVVCCFICRGYLLEAVFSRAQKHIRENYKASLSISSIRFSSLNTIAVKDLALIPDGADTFLRISTAEVSISFSDLLRARILPHYINITGATINIYNEEGRNNISFLRRKKNDDGSNEPKATGYKERVTNWEKRLFQLLNTAFEAKNIQIQYQDSSITESLYIPSFTYDLSKLSGRLIDQKNIDTLAIDGMVLKRKKAYQLIIRQLGNDSIYLPFLERERHLECRFHSISANVRFDNNEDACKIITDASLENFHINHWRLANDDVILENAKFKGTFTFTTDAIELDSSSLATLGTASCHLFANYHVLPDTTFMIGIHMPEIASDSFFTSLPEGMFNTLKGISCSGILAYDLDFAIHTNEPDSLLFYSAMKQKNLRIQHYGAENYARINGPFVYDAYDKDRFVRHITIGPDNPYFTPLTQMSAFLPQSVLQAEDPSFMQHRGFYLDAFRESIAKNYKEKRFARGGSTISMQLVKNVFLNRDKTISRKAEEALIVYLIENLGLVSKERMLEVYLNVIEWGPNVYGIGEAAHFYFNKRPSELTLPESLFLASIIPRPKSFQYEFDKEGQLRASMSDYFKILSTRMVWRGVLNPSDTVGLAPKVTLKGAALHVILPKDSTVEEPDETE
jgi:hypothetical protein